MQSTSSANSWYLHLAPPLPYNHAKCGSRMTCSFRGHRGVHRSAYFEDIGVSKYSADLYKMFISMEMGWDTTGNTCIVLTRLQISADPVPHIIEFDSVIRMKIIMVSGTRRVTQTFLFGFASALPSPHSLRSFSPLLSTSHDRARTPSSHTISYAWIFKLQTGPHPEVL